MTLQVLLAFSLLCSSSAAQVLTPGSIDTALAVTPSGVPVSHIEVPLPPGAGGLQPKLFLQYSGSSQNIGLGSGWSIGGYFRITRGNKSWITDKHVAGVQLTNDDAFYLDGDRIVPVATETADGITTVHFRKEQDDATTIDGHFSGTGAFDDFVLQSKAGLTTVFKAGPSISVSGATAPLIYLPTVTSDRVGNYIEWQFAINGLDINLAKVLYTGFRTSKVSKPPFAEVGFNYDQVARASTSFLLGQPLTRSYRLRSIQITLLGDLAPAGLTPPTMDFQYLDVDTAERFFLTKVTYTGFGGLALQPVELTYRPVAQVWTNSPAIGIPVALSEGTGRLHAYQWATIKDEAGNKVSGLLTSFDTTVGLKAQTYSVSAAGWKTFAAKAPPVPFVDSTGRSTGVLLLDVDGDGLTDILQNDPASSVARAFLQTDTGWTENDSFAPPVPLVDSSGKPLDIRQVDLDGDKRPDLLVASADGSVKALLNKTTGFVESSAHEFTLAEFGSALSLDAQCDGLTEVLRIVAAGSQATILSRKSSAAGWSAESDMWNTAIDPGSPTHMWAVKILGEPCRRLLVNYKSGAQERYGVLLPNGNAWTEIPAQMPRSIIKTSAGGAALPRFADVNGDGGDDILIHTGSGGDAFTLIQAARANAAAPVVWVATPPEFAPPVPLQKDGLADRSVELRDVRGSGKADVVALPNPSRSVGNVYVANGSQWQATLDLAPPTAVAQDKNSAGFLRFVDINGDGLVDIVYNRGGTGPNAKGALRNTGAGWVDASSWAPPRPLQRVGDVESPAFPIDVDGDGIADLVYAYIDSTGVPVCETYLNRSALGATDWGTPAASWALPKPFAAVYGGDLGGKFVDLNGDGLVDVIYSFRDKTGKLITEAYLNTGSGWTLSPDFKVSVPFAIAHSTNETKNVVTNVQLLDVNGDRLPDLVVAFTDPADGTVTNGVFLNDGTKFASQAISQVPVLLDTNNNGGPNVSFQDLNGDGVLDLMVTSPSSIFSSNAYEQVYLGTGTGWTRAPQWDLPVEARSDLFGFDAVQILDVTGDGYPDLIFNAPQRDGTFKKGAFINTGQGWQKAADTLAPPDPLVNADGTDSGVRPIDVNGDYAPDLIRTVTNADGTLNKTVWLNPNSRSGMLESVANNGLTTTYAYAVLTEPAAKAAHAYTPGQQTAYPIIATVPVRPVVIGATVSQDARNTRSTSFSYSDFRYDAKNAISLGFAALDRNELPSSLKFHTEYLQGTYGLIGQTSLIRVSNQAQDGSDLVALSTDQKRWDVVPHDGQVVNGATYRYLQAELLSQQSERRDLTNQIIASDETDLTYDGWSNTVKTVATNADSSKQEITNVYGPDAEGIRFGRLLQSTAQHSRPGVASETRKASFSYAPKTLQLQSETKLDGVTAYTVTTSYERDAQARGNITSTTLSATSGSPHTTVRTTTVEYDSLGRTVSATTNASQHRSTSSADANTLSAALGLPGHLTDPNGLTATVTYDGLGRLLSKTASDGVTTSIERYLPAAIPQTWVAQADHANAVHATSCRGQHLPERRWFAPVAQSAEATFITSASGARRFDRARIYDASGQLLREVTQRTDGKKVRLVFLDYEYDDLGRLIGQSRPYFSGAKSHWVDRAYDVLDRPTREVRASQACYDFAYDGLKQTRVDALGHISSAVMNAAGLPLVITRQNGAQTAYTYDVLGRLLTIKPPSGAIRSFSYDAAGNRNHSTDPNAGGTDFVFDAFGQLIKQKAENAAIWTELAYDEIGRVIKVVRPDRTSNWTYDAPGFLGTLSTASVVNHDGPESHTYLQALEYDEFVRLKRATVSYNGSSNATVYSGTYVMSYDDESRLSKRVYPGSSAYSAAYVTTNTYDPDTGQLTTINDSRGPKPIWRLVRANASGEVSDVRFGNGTNDIRARDSATGNVTGSSVFLGKTALSSATYKYNLSGNLVARTDALTHASDTFGYDGNDRLIRAQTAGAITTVAYDLSDRIIQKSDVGNYTYGCGNGPADGVCQISGGPLGSQDLTYDDRGNVTVTQDYEAEYTSDNRVSRLNKNTPAGRRREFHSIFEYGPDGSRIYTQEHGYGEGSLRDKETLHLGMADRITTTYGTSKIVTDRYYVEAGDGAFFALDIIDRSAALNGAVIGPLTQSVYLHRDHLGSVTMLTGDGGAVVSRFKFDPWGHANGMAAEADFWNNGAAAAWTRGFTGHDQIPQFPLVHMNGRVFDTRLAEFLSVDPAISDPANSADLNGYTYARNSPLSLTDVSGFSFLGDLWDGIKGAVGGGISWIANQATNLWHDTASFVARNWREIASVAVAIAVVVVSCPTTGCTGGAAFLAGMAAGAAGAATDTALHGGTVEDVLGSAILGGVLGGLSGGVAAASLGPVGSAAGYGLVGGVRAAAYGGDFGRGFLAGTLTAGVPTNGFISGEGFTETAGRIAVSATVNGTISLLNNESFANGAISGAFLALSRQARNGKGVWAGVETVTGYVGLYESREATLIGLGAAGLLYGISPVVTFFDPNVHLNLDFHLDLEKGVIEQSGDKYAGLTLGHMVFYDTKGTTLNHELTHVPQWGAFGTQGFWNSYSNQNRIFGYCQTPFEKEAYDFGPEHVCKN